MFGPGAYRPDPTEGITAIAGMKTRAHLRDNIAAVQVQLTAAEERELRAQVTAIPVQGERHAPAMMKVIDR